MIFLLVVVQTTKAPAGMHIIGDSSEQQKPQALESYSQGRPYAMSMSGSGMFERCGRKTAGISISATSSYFSATSSGRLRAIFTASYVSVRPVKVK